MKKTQISMEFVLLVTFMLFVFIVFFSVVQYRLAEATHEKELELLKQVGESIRNELTLAANVEDGYERTFIVPENVIGRDYDIYLINYGTVLGLELGFGDSLTVDTVGGATEIVEEKSVFVSLPAMRIKQFGSASDTFCEISKGDNIIKKEDGIIDLPACS